MKSRSIGFIFVAAVIVPSVLLAVLSIRAAGREEAFIEKQLAATLLAEVTQTAGLARRTTTRIADELRSSIDVRRMGTTRGSFPAGGRRRRLSPSRSSFHRGTESSGLPPRGMTRRSVSCGRTGTS